MPAPGKNLRRGDFSACKYNTAFSRAPRLNYDCEGCVGYCCAYPIIQVTREDLRRLGKFLGLTEADVRKEYTVVETNPRVRRLKLTKDALFKGESCVFLDKKTRFCTVYKGRPSICREHPGSRCEWHDRNQIETAMAGKGKKVVLLKELPWTVDADYPFYDEKRVTPLLKSYADGSGKIKD